MHGNWKGNALVVALLVVIVGGLLLANRSGQVLSQEGRAPAGFPRYSVIDTEGTNLIVTDNQENVLYFYTVDKEEKPGAELKLRGSVDLKEVGKPVLIPKMSRQ
jgi:hypothetical protein